MPVETRRSSSHGSAAFSGSIGDANTTTTTTSNSGSRVKRQQIGSARFRKRPNIAQRTMTVLKSATLSLRDYYLQQDCIMDERQLRRLSDHKYSAQDTSWLDEFCMKRFWDNVVKVYPLWLAPNLITLIGLIVNISTVLTLSFFSSNAREDAPRWAYFLAALGLFIYQTLDATDGKQARRTNSASPLGELFDHGCDSLAQVFVSQTICLSMQIGDMRYHVLIFCVFAVILFYCAHWSTYCTGTLKFSKFDVTEAQMCVIFVLFLTGIFGPKIWSLPILFGLPTKYGVIGTAGLISVWQLWRYVHVIFSGGVGKNGSTVADTSVIGPLFPLLAVIIPFIMVYSKSSSTVYDDHIVLYCMCFGFVAAKATNRLVVAHMSKSELGLWDGIHFAPILMMLNQYYDYVLSEHLLLWIATLYALANLLLYCNMVCRQFCDYLQINCFTISTVQSEHSD